MRTGAGLALICVGAILAFAVKAHGSVVNVQIIGWILMLTGVVGLLLPRRAYGWLGGRRLVRRTRTWPGAVPEAGTGADAADQEAAEQAAAGQEAGEPAAGERVDEPTTTLETRAVPPYVARNPGTSRERAGLPPEPSLGPDSVIRTPEPDEGDEVVEDLYER